MSREHRALAGRVADSGDVNPADGSGQFGVEGAQGVGRVAASSPIAAICGKETYLEVGEPLVAQQPDEVGEAVLLGASPELQ